MKKSDFTDRLYYYKAVVERIIDGDTMDVLIDQGLHITGRRERIRFARINAPEKRGDTKAEGLEATEFVKFRCPEGSEIFLLTVKDKSGGFGRFLGEVYFEHPHGSGELVNLNDLMVSEGQAEYKDY